MLQKLLFFILIAFCSFNSNAQTTLWGVSVGGSTADASKVCKVAPNGNVYVAGKFTGTMDLDPGAGVHNVTSNGQDDIFVSCFSPTGNFLWGFSIGGSSYDAALYMATDASSNLIICGYIQSAGIDFDPSAAGAYIGYAGGSGLPYNGDGFIAKYSPSGAYLWALDLGTTSVNDAALSVATDAPGNIYVAGVFDGVMGISGSASLSWVSGGQAYLIKYSASGTLAWGHNFGVYGADCYPNSLQVSGSSLYMGGFFSGTSNFNSWGSGAYLTSTGNNDPFIAKYDTAGNYVFAHAIKGNGNDDEITSVCLDSASNIYVTGFTNSPSLIFDPSAPSSSTFSAPGSGGNYDYFIARYSSSGAYQWGKISGASGDDYGYGNEISKGYLYNTGGFHNTVDFDPSAAVANLSSAGGEDIFLTKYDLNGNYICGFRAGASGTDDIGYCLAHADSGYLYNTGQFGGSGIDFNPSAFTLPLTSAGGTDAYLVKYHWGNDTTFTGSLTGDTICLGQPAYLTLHITSGNAGPYTLSISNGTTTTTTSGIYPGVPFLITPTPIDTTTYTVTGALPSGANLCTLPPASVLGSATVIVHFLNTTITNSLVGCNSLRLSASSGDTTYHWDFGDGDTSSLNPVVHTYTAIGTFIASVTIVDTNHCMATDTAMFSIHTPPLVSLGPDTFLCANSYTLQSSYTYPSSATYLWSNGSTTSSIVATTTNTYRLKVTDGLCSVSDTVLVTLKQQPIVSFGHDTSFCQGHSITLGGFIPGGSTYTWSTGSTAPSITVNTTGIYWLNVNNGGCTAHDSICVTVKPVPPVHLGPDKSQCQGAPIILSSTDTTALVTYLWNTGAPTSILLVNTSGTYWLTVSLNGCSMTDSINVTIKPNPVVDLGNDAYLCIGASLTVTSAQPAGAQYQWSTGSTGPSITVTEPGTYGLTVNNNGCIDSDQIVVYQIKAPTLNLGQDTIICDGYVLHLLATADQATYLWSDGSGGKSFNITQSGTYWSTITNDCGVATDTINVQYKFCDIWFPNAFTPNGDGKNDILRVKGSLNEFSEYSLYIFNRWGEMLYKTEILTDGWDGNYKNVPQENGTYYYMMYYKANGKKEMLKGDFQLIR
jgi:gliding motility-associated-like protein